MSEEAPKPPENERVAVVKKLLEQIEGNLKRFDDDGFAELIYYFAQAKEKGINMDEELETISEATFEYVLAGMRQGGRRRKIFYGDAAPHNFYSYLRAKNKGLIAGTNLKLQELGTLFAKWEASKTTIWNGYPTTYRDAYHTKQEIDEDVTSGLLDRDLVDKVVGKKIEEDQKRQLCEEVTDKLLSQTVGFTRTEDELKKVLETVAEKVREKLAEESAKL